MIKKLLLVLVFISLGGLLAFGDDGEQCETVTEGTVSVFPLWRIPLLLIGISLIAANIFYVIRYRENSTGKKKIHVLTEEEIRDRSCELYNQHKVQNGDISWDWHRSVRELTAYYEAQGYRVVLYWEFPSISSTRKSTLLCLVR